MSDGWLRLFLVSLFVSLCAGTLTPFSPPALPLAVKTPYLNTWMPFGDQRPEPLQQTEPQFWTGGNSTTWIAAIRVDNVTYALLGNPLPQWQNASLKAIDFTTTSCSILNEAAGVFVNMTFLSPITPTDLVRQTLPFTYLSVNVTSSDGLAHDIQVYTEIIPDWLTGDQDLVANWSSTVHDNAIVHTVQLTGQTNFTDLAGFAQGASLYYAMAPVSEQTFQIGSSNDVKTQFNSGALDDTVDQKFRAINNDFPSMAIVADLGSISSTGDSPIVFTLGVINDPSIQYATSNTTVESRSSFYWSNFSSALDVVSFVLGDYATATTLAAAFESSLMTTANGVSSQLADLILFATRQVMSSVDITITKDESRNWNMSDVKAFQKDFPTGAITQVDVLYSSFPAFLHLNPELAGYLLIPLLEYQDGLPQQELYAAQNLGSFYPNATGNNVPHNMGIEESANMIIMGLAHAQRANDTSLLTRHYGLFSQWAEYLGNNSLNPGSQSNPFALPTEVNQTNVALKGILGVAAMSRVSALLNKITDTQRYNHTGETLLRQWISLAIPSQHNVIFATYGASASSALVYNLFVDQFLGLNVVPEMVYQAQEIALGALHQSTFGIALDSNNPRNTSLDAMMMTAAALRPFSPQSAAGLISRAHEYLTEDQNHQALFSVYDTDSGVNVNTVGANRPSVGAVFALLAQGNADPLPQVTFASSGLSHRNLVIAVVVGVIGLIGLAAAVGGALYFLHRLRRRRQLQRAPILPTVASWQRLSTDSLPPVAKDVLADQIRAISMVDRERVGTHSQPTTLHTLTTSFTLNTNTISSKYQSPSTESPMTSIPVLSSSMSVPNAWKASPDRRSEAVELRGEMDRLRQEVREEMEELRRTHEVPPAYPE